MNRYLFIIYYFFLVNRLFCIPQEGFPIWKYLTPIEITEFGSGLNGIDCIYVINLDFRTEKWKIVEAFYKKYNLVVNRVSAVNGWELSKEIQKELAYPYPIRLTPGALGCLLSHISILKDAYEREFSIIWIMEDDVEFLEDPKVLETLIPTLFTIDPEWDIFYTDVDYRNPNGYTRSLGLDPRPNQQLYPLNYYVSRDYCHKDIMRIRSRYGTHSIILTRKGIKKILDYYTSRPLWTNIDIDTHYIPGISQYSSRRDIISNIIAAISDNMTSNL